MSTQDWAEEKANAILNAPYSSGEEANLEQRIAAALREALERAATTAIEKGKSVKGGYSNAAWEIAEAIRALKSERGSK